MSLVWIVLLPFAGSLCVAFMPSHARNTAAGWRGRSRLSAPSDISALPADSRWRRGACRVPWAPGLGLDFTFRMDGFAWLFAMLVTVMGALVVLYARYYMAAQDPVPRFFSFLLAFMGSMLGVVLSGNLIQLVVFWELTSLTSFMLIGLLVSPCWMRAGRPHGADCDRGRRFVPARGHADAGTHCRQL